MKILIVKTSAIGDVTHTLPALHALRRQFPVAKIDWLVEEAAADLISDHPYLNRVLISRRKSWIKDFKKGRLCKVVHEAFSFIKELRKVKYDLLIDFQGLLKSSIFIACCRSRRKVGFDKGMEHAEHSHLFLNERIAAVDMDIHAVDRERLLLEAIGVEEPGKYSLFISKRDINKVYALLTREDVDLNKPLIAINPMTTWPTKHWNNRGFSEVADYVCELGASVVFTGGKADRENISEIIAGMKTGKAVNLAGKTSLKLLAALYKQTRAVISTDTGPMHIAAAAGTLVVAIFGSTAPWRTGPYGKQHRIIRLSNLKCSPCLKKECDNRQCMEGIDAMTVKKELFNIIQ